MDEDGNVHLVANKEELDDYGYEYGDEMMEGDAEEQEFL